MAIIAAFLPLHPMEKSLMKEGQVKKPGNERPCFLGIPTPEGTADKICPDRAGDDTKGLKRKTDGE